MSGSDLDTETAESSENSSPSLPPQVDEVYQSSKTALATVEAGGADIRKAKEPPNTRQSMGVLVYLYGCDSPIHDPTSADCFDWLGEFRWQAAPSSGTWLCSVFVLIHIGKSQLILRSFTWKADPGWRSEGFPSGSELPAERRYRMGRAMYEIRIIYTMPHSPMQLIRRWRPVTRFSACPTDLLTESVVKLDNQCVFVRSETEGHTTIPPAKRRPFCPGQCL